MLAKNEEQPENDRCLISSTLNEYKSREDDEPQIQVRVLLCCDALLLEQDLI